MGRIIISFLFCFNVLASDIKIGDCYKYNKDYFLVRTKTQYGYFMYFYNEHKKHWLSVSEVKEMEKIRCEDVIYKH
jgi:hypothetical protein